VISKTVLFGSVPFIKRQHVHLLHCRELNTQSENPQSVWAQWFTSVTPAIEGAEIGRIAVEGHPGQKVNKTQSQSIS
jgi:hypothetical protein